MMDVERAKEEVITAGRKLVEKGLIARTWGNVSCRIDDKCFAITPSGMAYEKLRPQDIVVVNIADLKYCGNVKPSSEKGIHAAVYAQKPYINFVIHTHQANVSVASVLGKDVEITGPQSRKIIGDRAILAAYSLPGTKRLCKNVFEALKQPHSKAILMAHHGVLCFGEDSAHAFDVAMALEIECQKFIVPLDDALYVPHNNLHDSKRGGNGFVFDPGGDSVTADIKTGKAVGDDFASLEMRLHRAIYSARKDINVIKGSALPAVIAASVRFHEITPLLDDFAQIIGPSLSAVEQGESNGRFVQALKGRNAVLLKGAGALCCAGNEGDASAVAMVLEKGCMAYLSAASHGAISPISPAECKLMRFVYIQKYAKKMKKL